MERSQWPQRIGAGLLFGCHRWSGRGHASGWQQRAIWGNHPRRCIVNHLLLCRIDPETKAWL